MDTAAKRFSAMRVGSPWRGAHVVPTGTINAAYRLAIAFLYSGIAASAVAPPSALNPSAFRRRRGVPGASY